MVVFRLASAGVWLLLVLFFVCSLNRPRVGDDADLCCCCCPVTIQDFLRNFVSDRAGEPPGDSAFVIASVRLFSGLRLDLESTDGSLLLLEKDKNLDDRREAILGLKGGMWTASVSGASSDDGLVPRELSDVLAVIPPLFRSSSEMLPLRSTTGGSCCRSLTRGK
jgi:hypothetical protein